MRGAVGDDIDKIDFSPVTIMYCKLIESLLKAMRNIMRHNEEKEKKQRNVDNDFDEEDCSLQEILEAKFDELFGTAQIDEENS